MINRIMLFALTIMMLLSVQLTGCSSSKISENGGTGQENVVPISCDWPQYSDVKDLVGEADLIVVGKVTSVNNSGKSELKLVLKDGISAEHKQKIEKNNPNYEPVTVSTVKVEKVIKGQAQVEGDIKVKQLGGVDNGVKYIEDSTEYFEKGERNVLFLKKAAADDTYITLNPEQGHIRVVNGKIKAVVGNKLFNAGISEDELIRKVREVV